MVAAADVIYRACPECGGPTEYAGIAVRDRDGKITRWRFTCIKAPPHVWNVVNPDYKPVPVEHRVCMVCEQPKPAAAFIGSICGDCVGKSTKDEPSVPLEPPATEPAQQERPWPPPGHDGHNVQRFNANAWRCWTCSPQKKKAEAADPAIPPARELAPQETAPEPAGAIDH